MLKTVVLRENNKKKYWKEFNPLKATWVVSDLKTKVFLNRALLQDREIIYNEPVKRAAELWLSLLQDQIAADTTSVGGIGAWCLAKKFLTEKKGEWFKRPRAPQSLLGASKQFVSFITHELATEYLEEFKKAFPGRGLFFLELAYLGIEFYNFCLQQKRIPRFFVPSLLAQNFDNLPKNHRYFFDLGSEILQSEKDLLQELAKNNEVTVFESEKGNHSPSPFEVWRCPSLDAEGRMAAAQISRWIDQGISPDEICVAAEDISFYENILDDDLQWYGIGLQRDLSSPISGHGFFQRLTAMLRVAAGSWEPQDLMEAYPQLTFAERRILKPALDTSQIAVTWLQNEVSKLQARTPQGEFDFELFQELILLLKYQMKITASQDSAALNPLLICLQKLKTETLQLKFDLTTWIEAWEKTVVQSDFIYKMADSNGVWALDFHSVDEVSAKYFIFLGMNLKPAKKNYAAELNPREKSFFEQLGFYFDTSSQSWDEMIPTAVASKAQHCIFSCAAVDAQGKSLSPTPVWMELAKTKNKNPENCDAPESLLWLDLQRGLSQTNVQKALSKIKSWPDDHLPRLLAAVGEELHQTKSVSTPSFQDKTLSASAIEQTWQCPFKFFAAYGLGLRVDEDLDVEPTPLLRGQILHGAVEKIWKAGLESWDTQRLLELLDELARVQAVVASDVWPSTRARLHRQLIRFIEFEKAWKKKFPLAQPVGFEVAIEGFICTDGKEIKFSQQEPIAENSRQWKFKGRVDRIDSTADGHGIILDYKDRVTKLTNISSWQKNGQLQLGLYAQALEGGLGEVKVKSVIGSFFYSLKNLDRKSGFGRADINLAGILPDDLPRNACVDEMKLKDFYTDLNATVSEVLAKIETGSLTPAPKQAPLCETCSWNNLCRSHTLL